MQISKHAIKSHHFPIYFIGPPLISHPPSYSLHLFLHSLDPPPSFLQKPPNFPISRPPARPSVSRCVSSFAHQLFDIMFLRPRGRLFSTSPASDSSSSSPMKKTNARNTAKGKRINSKLSAEERGVIVDSIKQDGGKTLDQHLNKVSERLSIECLTQIFNTLNGQKLSGLPLFLWVLNTRHDLYRNSNFCSLIIDNCGWLDDYESMSTILNDFKSQNLCLTSKAFTFLPSLNSSKSSLIASITKLTRILNNVGGSCRSSGILGMIEMLCKLEAFEMADFIMSITERKPQYYKVMVREKCKRLRFQDARATLDDMRRVHCEPDVGIYNYLLSSLCKNGRLAEARAVFEEMKGHGNRPNALTFDIFVHFTAREGMLEAANEFLNEMISAGIKPRMSTHAVIIKGFLNSGESKECGIGSEVVEYHKRHKNMIYCLLAGFHQQKGDVFRAANILMKMMDKSLRPNLSTFRRVLNQVKNEGRDELARDLQIRFSSFKLES